MSACFGDPNCLHESHQHQIDSGLNSSSTDDKQYSQKKVSLDHYVRGTWGSAQKGKAFKKYRNRMMKAAMEGVVTVNGNN